MIGPEVPQKIQDIRDKRLRRAVAQEQSEGSDDDFAGPSLEDFRDDAGKVENEEAAKQRLRSARIAQFKKNRDTELNENDLKHDSWMSMKPEWDQKPQIQTLKSQVKTTDSKDAIERAKKPSLLEQHQLNRKKQGVDGKEQVTYNSEESLNAEVRKEVFRKASSLSDRFTKGS